jgi:hypothetical protein
MEYICKICKKDYSSYKSLWYHNYKYHKHPVNNPNTVVNNLNTTVNPIFKCNFCNKEFNTRQSKSRHELHYCKNNKLKEKDDEIQALKKELGEYKKDIIKDIIVEYKEIKKQNEELMKLLKVHPKTLTKMNNNGCLINNGTMNVQIVQLGHENLHEVLNDNQKLSILNKQAMSLNQLIELIHTNPEFTQFRNVCITNLQSSVGFKYCDKAKKFLAVNKNELLNDLIENRIYDIQNFYKEIESKMTPDKANKMKKFIDRMLNEPELKNLKKEEIKLILYNNRDKINTELDNNLKELEI